MREYNNYKHGCPKCKTIIDVDKYFFDFAAFGDYYAGDFKVYCEVCNHKFIIKRCVLVTYKAK